MQTIKLTQGKETIVDDEDFERFGGLKWRFSHGYAIHWGPRKQYKREVFYLHRLVVGAKKGEMIDHINGNPLDNRQENLRTCTNAQNQANAKKRPGTSRFKGVGWHKIAKKWRARVAGVELGLFASEEEAARVYDKVARKRFGEFARLNDV